MYQNARELHPKAKRVRIRILHFAFINKYLISAEILYNITNMIYMFYSNYIFILVPLLRFQLQCLLVVAEEEKGE